jgi:hypothetical protein
MDALSERSSLDSEENPNIPPPAFTTFDILSDFGVGERGGVGIPLGSFSEPSSDRLPVRRTAFFVGESAGCMPSRFTSDDVLALLSKLKIVSQSSSRHLNSISNTGESLEFDLLDGEHGSCMGSPGRLPSFRLRNKSSRVHRPLVGLVG